MPRVVSIDCFPDALDRYDPRWAVVAVDIIRATTTAVTAAATGRRCFPVATLDEATSLAARLNGALLVGELGGAMPYGFDLTNSPAALAERSDVGRPIILLSTSGTKLLRESVPARSGLYAACLRNVRATVEPLVRTHGRVAVIGAGARGEFRSEDKLGCARIAAGLMDAGFRPLLDTADVVSEWATAPVDRIAHGPSAGYLIDTEQLEDLHFVLAHEDDVDSVVALRRGELVTIAAPVRGEPVLP